MPAVFFLNQVKRLRGTDDVESIFLAIKSNKYVYPEGIVDMYTQRALQRYIPRGYCIW